MCQCRFEMPGSCPGEGNCPMVDRQGALEDAIDSRLGDFTGEDFDKMVGFTLNDSEREAFNHELAMVIAADPMKTTDAMKVARYDAILRAVILAARREAKKELTE